MKIFLNSTFIALVLCWSSVSLSAQKSYHVPVPVVNNTYEYHYNTSNQHNKASHAKLGVSLEKDETSVLVKRVLNNSAAKAAGLQAGDRLIAFDNVKVWGTRQLIAMVHHNKGGETVRLDYQRNGQMFQTNVTLKTQVNQSTNSSSTFQNPCEEVEKITGRPFLGVYLDRNREEDRQGARITSIIKNTGAAASDLQAEDRIIGLDGAVIRNSRDVHNHIQDTKKPTEPMAVEVLRDGQRVTLTAIVGSWGDRQDMQQSLRKSEAACETYTNPASACAALQQMEGSPFLGVYMTNVNSDNGGGALITSVIEGTQAAQSTLKGGDKIVRFNDAVINSHSEASSMILSTRPNDPVRLEVLRGDKIIKIDAVMGSLTSRPTNRAEATALAEVCALNETEAPVVVAPNETNPPALNIAEAEGTNLTLFPNPSSSYVNLVYEGQKGSLDVSIVTLDGKSLYNKKVPEFNGVYNDQISLNKFPAGIYMVSITQGETHTSKQLIIE